MLFKELFIDARIDGTIRSKKAHGLDAAVKDFSGGSIGRPHIAKMINKYYGISIEEIFRKILGDDCPCFIPSSSQDLVSTIKFIQNNDGIAVIAHPIHYKNTLPEEFVKLGIDGIECFYPEHKKKYSKKLVNLAIKNNLIIT
ncbi:MAG: hypothetical protein IJN00_05440, partial [Clostridia bacterium]|nr:hypothetical protein [Clostridia bacterium]